MKTLEITSTCTAISVTYEEPDELTQEELRRIITFARDVKAGRRAVMLVEPGVNGTRLRIMSYDKAA